MHQTRFLKILTILILKKRKLKNLIISRFDSGLYKVALFGVPKVF